MVLDTSAILFYYYGNIKVKRIIESNEGTYVNPVNLSEFLYAYAKVKDGKRLCIDIDF